MFIIEVFIKKEKMTYLTDYKHKYIFNHDYILYHDIHRTFIIRKYNNNNTDNFISMLHPIQAMILSFFCRPIDYKTAICNLSDFLEMNISEIDKFMNPLIENSESFYTIYDGHKFFLPAKIIIDANHNFSPVNEYRVDDFQYTSTDFVTQRIIKTPIHITYMPSNKCITDCIYCYADKDSLYKKPLSIKRLREIIKEAKKASILQFNLVGGEIFTHPHWKTLIKMIIKSRFDVSTISTKVPLKENDIVFLKKMNINSIQISLDSIDNGVLKNILKVNDNYLSAIKETIGYLNKYNIKITINTVITSANSDINNIINLYNYIKNIPNIVNWSVRPAFPSLYKTNLNFMPSRASLDALSLEITKLRNEFSHININFERTHLEKNYISTKGGSKNFKGASCSALKSHFFILPDGQVTICEQLYWKRNFIIGDLKIQSISEVWNSNKSQILLNLKQDILSEDNPCKSCNIFCECYSNMNRCWAEVIKAYGDSKWDYPDPRCYLAPKAANSLTYH